jgi:hypothetical protein
VLSLFLILFTTISNEGNAMNYQSACTWDICELMVVDEMLRTQGYKCDPTKFSMIFTYGSYV